MFNSWIAELVSRHATSGLLIDANLLFVHLVDRVRSDLASLVLKELTERAEPTSSIVAEQCYVRLGLTDAAIALSAASNLLVLTNDLDLSIYLQRTQHDCIHYDRDLRPQALGLDEMGA